MKFKIGPEEVEITRKHAISYVKYGGVLLLFTIVQLLIVYGYAIFTSTDFYDAGILFSTIYSWLSPIFLVANAFLVFLLLKNKDGTLDKKDLAAFCIINFILLSVLYLLLSVILFKTLLFMHENFIEATDLYLLKLLFTVIETAIGSTLLYVYVSVVSKYRDVFKHKNLILVFITLVISLVTRFLVTLFQLIFQHPDNVIYALSSVSQFLELDVLTIINNVLIAFFILVYFVQNRGKISRYFYWIAIIYIISPLFAFAFGPTIQSDVLFFRIIFHGLIYLAGIYLLKKSNLS